MTTPHLCILIPTYNNEGTLPSVISSFSSAGLPVLVINDGSTDASSERAKATDAVVIDHPINRGKGRALSTGWAEALDRGFTHVLAVDADGQHLAADLPLFLDALRNQPDALIIGNRDMDSPRVPQSSRVGRRISDFMLWAAAADELEGVRPDTQCGYRLYPLKAVLALPLRGGRYEMEMEVLVRAAWMGVPLVTVPISVHYPPAEERVSHFRKWADNVRIVGMYTRLMLMRLFWPLFRPKRTLAKPPGS